MNPYFRWTYQCTTSPRMLFELEEGGRHGCRSCTSWSSSIRTIPDNYLLFTYGFKGVSDVDEAIRPS